jgi:hypothetical protein
MQKVYLVTSDRKRIVEADLNKLAKHQVYFLTYSDALASLLFSRLESVLDKSSFKGGYSKPLKQIEDLAVEIRELEKKQILKQESLTGFSVHGVKVAPLEGVFY